MVGLPASAGEVVGAVEIAETVKPGDRVSWREWLARHHADAREIWLLYDDRDDVPSVSYLDAVEEAICFGWIDGMYKRASEHELAQRFSPRRPKSHWSELNKERARRLIRSGLMTEAWLAVLPDLDAPFAVPDDITERIKVDPDAWRHWAGFPDLYRRVRISYIDEARNRPEEFERRLGNLLRKTAAGEMFGNWNDGGRLG